MSDCLDPTDPRLERSSIAAVSAWWRREAAAEPDPDLADTYLRLADELEDYAALRGGLP